MTLNTTMGNIFDAVVISAPQNSTITHFRGFTRENWHDHSTQAKIADWAQFAVHRVLVAHASLQLLLSFWKNNSEELYPKQSGQFQPEIVTGIAFY